MSKGHVDDVMHESCLVLPGMTTFAGMSQLCRKILSGIGKILSGIEENPVGHWENPVGHWENPVGYWENPVGYWENPVGYWENPVIGKILSGIGKILSGMQEKLLNGCMESYHVYEEERRINIRLWSWNVSPMKAWYSVVKCKMNCILGAPSCMTLFI